MTTTAAPAAAVPPRIFLDTRRRLSGFPFAQVQCKMSTSSCLFDALSVESVDDCHFGGIGRSLLSRRVSSRSKKKRRKKEAKVEQRNFSGKVQSLAPLSCVCFFFQPLVHLSLRVRSTMNLKEQKKRRFSFIPFCSHAKWTGRVDRL